MENIGLGNNVTDIAPVVGCIGNNIPYYDDLTHSEQSKVVEVIHLLWRQTFILERKYGKRIGRFRYNKGRRICDEHLEFARNYPTISGVGLHENSQMDVTYIQGENVVGDKLPHLTALYLLVLKLIYDRQMGNIPTSVNVRTSLYEIYEKLGNHRLSKKQPALTDIRRAVTLLKKYQIIEPSGLLEDLKSESRVIIYPCANMVLMGDGVHQLLPSSDGDTDNSGVQLRVKLEGEDADDMTAREGEPWNRK